MENQTNLYKYIDSHIVWWFLGLSTPKIQLTNQFVELEYFPFDVLFGGLCLYDLLREPKNWSTSKDPEQIDFGRMNFFCLGAFCSRSLKYLHGSISIGLTETPFSTNSRYYPLWNVLTQHEQSNNKTLEFEYMVIQSALRFQLPLTYSTFSPIHAFDVALE